jgi:tRNA (guanine37-N1)-methyltransferase
MVMRPEPWGRALDDVRPPGTRLVVPTPAGERFTQAMAAQWSAEPGLVFACGRYEGIDQRVADWARGSGPVSEVSLGDYVLAGGESAVLVMVEAVTRLLPGVVGNRKSVEFDSHADGLLEGPAYTRPASWRGHDVPEVLLSGDHAAIARWRRAESVRRTAARRPDLLAALAADALSDADRTALDGD